MQFVDQGNGDEIPHLMWSWVLPLEKKTRWNECRIEIKRELTMQLRMNFYFVFDFKMQMQANNNAIKIRTRDKSM